VYQIAFSDLAIHQEINCTEANHWRAVEIVGNVK